MQWKWRTGHTGHMAISMKLIVALILCITPAYSYADPGSGVLIYQIIAAAAVSAVFYVRKLLFSFRRKRKD